LTTDLPYPLIEPIQERFERAGWTPVDDRPGVRWVENSAASTTGGTVRVRYLPTVDRLVDDVDLGGLGAQIGVTFDPSQVTALVDAIVAATPRLDPDSWHAFVAACRRHGEGVVEIVDGSATSIEGVPALRPRSRASTLADLLLEDEEDDDDEVER
jgi:hypothetical protein